MYIYVTQINYGGYEIKGDYIEKRRYYGYKFRDALRAFRDEMNLQRKHLIIINL